MHKPQSVDELIDVLTEGLQTPRDAAKFRHHMRTVSPSEYVNIHDSFTELSSTWRSLMTLVRPLWVCSTRPRSR
jgi:hypothetical protein